MGHTPSLSMTECDSCDYTDVLKKSVDCPMCEHGTMQYPNQ